MKDGEVYMLFVDPALSPQFEQPTWRARMKPNEAMCVSAVLGFLRQSFQTIGEIKRASSIFILVCGLTITLIGCAPKKGSCTRFDGTIDAVCFDNFTFGECSLVFSNFHEGITCQDLGFGE